MKYKKKANLIVGGRFQAQQTLDALENADFDVMLYTSCPKRFWKGVPNKKILFIPKIDQIISKIFKIKLPRFFSTISSIFFDYFTSILMRPADLIYGFNGDSLLCGLKQKKLNPNSKYLVDRACPHFLTQNELMLKESKEVQYPFRKHSEIMKERFCKEYEIADKIITSSNFSLNSFLERGFNKNKLYKAPLDGNVFINEANFISKNNLSNSNNKNYNIGFVGSAFLRKGIIYLLRSLNYLKDENITLLMRSNKNQIYAHNEARMLCEKYNVKFIPYMKNMEDFYNKLDIFVVPSIEEGFGMVLYEALRCRLPIIATANVGAIDELENNLDFIEIQPKDSQELAKQIKRLIQNPDLREFLASNAIEKYKKLKHKGSIYNNSIKSLIDEIYR